MKYGGKQVGGGGGGFEQPPVGKFKAVLAAIYDVGFQSDFDKSKAPKHKLAMVWELECRDAKGRRFVIVEKVNVSSHPESVLASRFAALNDREPTETEIVEGFDDAMMVGKSCIVKTMRNVANPKGKTYIKAVSEIMDGSPGLRVEGDYTTPPKLVTWMLENAVDPTPTPPNKSAVAASQEGALPSREPGDETGLTGRDSPF